MRVSARAIVIHDNKLLLNKCGDGIYYNFPGGGIEEHESGKMAVVREVLEETGLNVAVSEFLFTLDAANAYSHFSLFFKCELIDGNEIQNPTIPDINPADPSLVIRAEWVSLDELSGLNILPPIADNIKRYVETGVFTPALYEHEE